MVDFVRAIKRPFTDFKKFGIGVLICFFVAIMPSIIRFLASFFIAGYGIKCARTAMNRE